MSEESALMPVQYQGGGLYRCCIRHLTNRGEKAQEQGIGRLTCPTCESSLIMFCG